MTALDALTSDCPSGKIQYTKDGARDALRSLGPRFRSYRCEMCGTIHVGHRRRADKKGRTR